LTHEAHVIPSIGSVISTASPGLVSGARAVADDSTDKAGSQSRRPFVADGRVAAWPA
jgi:hypothetical protein